MVNGTPYVLPSYLACSIRLGWNVSWSLRASVPSSGAKKPFLAKAGVQPTSERSTSGAPLEPAAVSNLFCAWSKGTLTYLTLMSLLAASNCFTRAWYVGASLVALEVSHQVMVTGPSASSPLSLPPQAVAARARDATSAVAAMPRRMSSP